jgi:hypothetical protein
VETVPGTYRFSLAPHRGGIWRWEVVFEDGEVMFVDELRAELFGVAHSAQAEPAQAAEPGGGEG